MKSGFVKACFVLATALFALALAGCADRLVVTSRPGQFNPPPQPTDKVRYCDSWYPVSASGEGRQTVMSARITANGDLADVAVTGSSGNADLDAAAVTCAAHTYVRPAVWDGKPIEIVWTFEVLWHVGGHSFVTIKRPAGYPLTCSAYYPASAAEKREAGSTLVSFVVDTDGRVSRPEVMRSSGFEDLDQAASACVTAWRYLPATRDGKPAAFGWRAIVDWRTVGES
ncbi:MAG: TonB family protein [Alphaproteobacteria bacterium]|nr:TonB family protein [Alphaproteobacteria bacterium]